MDENLLNLKTVTLNLSKMIFESISINLLFIYSEEDISRNAYLILTGCESKTER
jgi:hypothetical protein